MGSFDMLTVEHCPERGVFKHLSKTLFTVCNIENTYAMRVILFFKMFRLWCRFRKWTKKIEKRFLFSEIIALDIVPGNYNCYKENTCHRHSLFLQRVVTVLISLTERFSKLASLRVTKQFDKSTFMEISQVFGTH